MDYYLRATTEQELWDTLVTVGAATKNLVKDPDGNVIEDYYSTSSEWSLDVIGTIYKSTGNMIQHTDTDGNTFQIPETEPLNGFHANLRGPVDLAPKVEIIPYQPTTEELADPEFKMPEAEQRITPSPLAALLVYPTAPVRVWF